MAQATAAFAAYLGLPEPRLVLDLRPTPSFAHAHIAHSTHVFPLHKLKDRYSSLPPRTVPFLVLAQVDQADQVLEAFKASEAARVLFLDAGESTEQRTDALTCQGTEFFRLVDEHHLLRHCNDDSISTRIDSHDDWPHLLFRPSPAVQRLMESSISHNRTEQARILDLGCGAGRDLAWILYQARRRLLNSTWSGVGLDNWKAALSRASILLRDLDLLHSDKHGSCEQLVWAKCTDDGFLEPLVGTGKGKAVPFPPASEDEKHAVAMFDQANLSCLSAASKETGTGSDTYDLVLSIRFYPRKLMPRLGKIVKPGGRILISHFTVVTADERDRLSQDDGRLVIDYDSPAVEGRLEPGEAEDLVALWSAQGQDWTVADHQLEPIEDGRVIRSVVLKRLV